MDSINNQALLGIDLGTSSVKALLLSIDTGKTIADAAVAYSLHTPHPGWAEQNPADWLNSTIHCVQVVMDKAGLKASNVIAISFSGQMHGLICVDNSFNVIRPAIIWADQRSEAQCEHIKGMVARDFLINEIGNPVVTGFMLPSWLWLCEHEPETAKRTHKLLLPKDYLRYCFTEEVWTDPSDASGTLMLNYLQRNWSESVLDRFSIPRSLLPEITDSTALTGALKHEMAEALGLLPGTPVICGGSDQACQAVGQGAVRPNDVTCTIGTGGQVLAVCDQPVPDNNQRVHLFCHAVPHTWHYEAATLSAGLSLNWLRETVCPHQTYAEMADEASTVSPGCEGLFFHPYLLGERTPLMDPSARASFTGLSLRHGKQHLIRAVMEGVIMSLKQGSDILEGLGVFSEQIILSGGGTRHPLWIQLVADIFNKQVIVSKTAESSAKGAAILAGVGSGAFSSTIEANRLFVDYQDLTTLPNPRNVEIYKKVYQSYCGLMSRVNNQG